MKNTYLMIFFLSILLTSCVSYKIGTVSSDSKELNNNLVFENDTIRISYNFWGKNGLAGFDVYNKLNIPIYLDWKKSAFIPNDKMMSYWQDETNTTGSTLFSNYDYWGIFFFPHNVSLKAL